MCGSHVAYVGALLHPHTGIGASKTHSCSSRKGRAQQRWAATHLRSLHKPSDANGGQPHQHLVCQRQCPVLPRRCLQEHI